VAVRRIDVGCGRGASHVEVQRGAGRPRVLAQRSFQETQRCALVSSGEGIPARLFQASWRPLVRAALCEEQVVGDDLSRPFALFEKPGSRQVQPGAARRAHLLQRDCLNGTLLVAQRHPSAQQTIVHQTVREHGSRRGVEAQQVGTTGEVGLGTEDSHRLEEAK